MNGMAWRGHAVMPVSLAHGEWEAVRTWWRCLTCEVQGPGLPKEYCRNDSPEQVSDGKLAANTNGAKRAAANSVNPAPDHHPETEG